MLLCILLCFSLLAIGCTKKQGDGSEETTTANGEQTNPSGGAGIIPTEKLSEMKVVYANGADSELIALADTLTNTINNTFGVSIQHSSDRIREGSEQYSEKEYEILLGKTNREEGDRFYNGLKYEDFGYDIEGTKIVIYGGNRQVLEKAITDFSYEIVFMKKGGEGVFFSSELAKNQSNGYALENILLSGAEIRDYRVVYPKNGTAFEKQLATRLVSNIQLLTGYTLDCVSDQSDVSGREILIGATSRNTALTETGADEGSISMTGNHVQLYGKTARGNALAVEGLLSLIEGAKNEQKISEVILPETVLYRGEDDISVMSFNLLVASKSGVPNTAVKDRSPRVLEMILRYLPDVLGVQEAGYDWMSFLESNLSDYYSYVGIGRDDEGSGEHTAIFYAKERFTVTESGTKWLTDTPDTVSKLPNSKHNRIFTYAILNDKVSGESFLHINTHLDNSDDTIRTEQINFILKFLAEYTDIPVILTGDLNSSSGSTPIRSLKKTSFSSASDVAEKVDGLPGIDWIFITDDCIKPDTFYVLDDVIGDGSMISDHSPVYSELRIEIPEGGIRHQWEEVAPEYPDDFLDIEPDEEGKDYEPIIRFH